MSSRCTLRLGRSVGLIFGLDGISGHAFHCRQLANSPLALMSVYNILADTLPDRSGGSSRLIGADLGRGQCLPVVYFPQTALAGIGKRNDAGFSKIGVTTLKMFNHIIIAIDGSDLADRALETGLALAKALNAAVTLVTVWEKWSMLEIAAEVRMHVGEQVEHFEVVAARISLKILSTAQDKAARHNVTMKALHGGNRPVAEGIVSTASRQNCDLIVMACSSHRTSYGHGSSAWV